jgi:hypothetical protein
MQKVRRNRSTVQKHQICLLDVESDTLQHYNLTSSVDLKSTSLSPGRSELRFLRPPPTTGKRSIRPQPRKRLCSNKIISPVNIVGAHNGGENLVWKVGSFGEP